VVGQDNTVAIKDRWWQIEHCRWRYSLAGTTVTIHEHLDQTVSIRYGPHLVGRYDTVGVPRTDTRTPGRGKGGSVENRAAVSHRPLEIAPGDAHYSTAPNPIHSLSPPRKKKRVA